MAEPRTITLLAALLVCVSAATGCGSDRPQVAASDASDGAEDAVRTDAADATDVAVDVDRSGDAANDVTDTAPPPDPIYWTAEATRTVDDLNFVMGPDGERVFALGLDTRREAPWDGVTGPNRCDRETGVGYTDDEATAMSQEAAAAGANFLYVWGYGPAGTEVYQSLADTDPPMYGLYQRGYGIDRPAEDDVIPVIHNRFGEEDMGEAGRDERVAEMERVFDEWTSRTGEFSAESFPNLPPFEELPWLSWHPTWRMKGGAEAEGQEALTDEMAARFAHATNMMIGDSYTYVVNRFESILNVFTGQRGEIDEGYEDWLDRDDPDHRSYFTAAWDIVTNVRAHARPEAVVWMWMQGYAFDDGIGQELCETGSSDAWAKGPFPSWAYLRKEITSTVVAGGTGIVFFGYMSSRAEQRDLMNRIFRSLSSDDVYGPALLSPRLELDQELMFTGEGGRAHVLAKWDAATGAAYLVIANPGAHATQVEVEFPWSIASVELLDWVESEFVTDASVTSEHTLARIAMPRDDGAIVRVRPLLAPE